MFNKTIYDITQNRSGAPDYLQFVGWVYLWGAILHWITAILNCEFVISSVSDMLLIRLCQQGVTSSNT